MNGEHSNAPAPLATDPASHTPGPWVAAAGPSSIVGWPVVGPRGRAVATVHYLRGDTPEGKRVNAEAGANACLVAAAPDLLEVLRDVVQYGGGMEYDDWRGLIKRAESAIAKAEGRS